MGQIRNLLEGPAIKKLKQIAMDAEVALFSTNILTIPLSTRPMTTQDVDDEGNIWFMSRSDSDKNKDIANDTRVELFYANKSNSEYLTVYGHAEVLIDRKRIEELWTPMSKAWFNKGKDDPSISLIKVLPVEAYYWDTKENKIMSLLKMAISAITGKENDDSIEGAIRISE
jgi:general stress protein 26